MGNVSPRSRYKYILSLPARAIRSLGALSGGLLREIGEVALPAAIRRTILYRTMVGVLRFLIEQVGEVEGIYPSESHLAEDFILQRTASHGIELLGILTFRASPIWVLAALADITDQEEPDWAVTFHQVDEFLLEAPPHQQRAIACWGRWESRQSREHRQFAFLFSIMGSIRARSRIP
jgi:hypothetical protein